MMSRGSARTSQQKRLRSYNYSNRKSGAAAHHAGRRTALDAACRAHKHARRDERAAWPPNTIESRSQRVVRAAARPATAFKIDPHHCVLAAGGADADVLVLSFIRRTLGRSAQDPVHYAGAVNRAGVPLRDATLMVAVEPSHAVRSFRIRLADFLLAQNAMSRAISDLFTWTGKLVRVLKNVQPMIRQRTRTSPEWKPGSDYRIICDCQRHARRQQALWRRSLRAASQFKKSGAVFLVGLPLALGMAGIPTEGTTDGAIPGAPAVAAAVNVHPERANTFRIFTDKVRSDFLDTQHETGTLTLEVAKEQFFRTRVPYGSIIYREATKNQLAPELVAAVVEAESDFRPRLISGKNAQGLMQIVPSTGELLGAGNLFDPEQNIAAGSKYLKYLIDRFGDLHLALAAYNAGEGNIEKFGGVPPFQETLNYVQRVSSHTRWYRQRVRDSFLASSRISTTYTR
jgi:hypothetical protein